MPATSTNFLNSKQRRIFQSERGAFFARAGDKKVYKPVAAFRKAGGDGATVKIAGGNASVPVSIRPKARAARKNKGVARGPREGYLQRLMNTQAARAAARPRRAPKRVPMNHGPNQGRIQRLMNTGSRRATDRRAQNALLAQNPYALLL